MSNHHRHLCDKRPLEHHRAIDRWMLTNLSFHEPVNHSHPIGGCVRFCYRFSFRPLFAQFDFLILSPKHSTIWLLFCGFEGFLIEASCILWHMSKYFSNGDRRPSTKRAICNIFAWVVGIWKMYEKKNEFLRKSLNWCLTYCLCRCEFVIAWWYRKSKDLVILFFVENKNEKTMLNRNNWFIRGIRVEN